MSANNKEGLVPVGVPPSQPAGKDPTEALSLDELRAMLEVLGHMLPVRLIETPDYAELHADDAPDGAQAAALTVHPSLFMLVNSIPWLLSLAREPGTVPIPKTLEEAGAMILIAENSFPQLARVRPVRMARDGGGCEATSRLGGAERHRDEPLNPPLPNPTRGEPEG